VPACRANRQAGADTQCRRWSFVGWPCEYAPARGVRAIALPFQPPVARWSPAVREGFKSGRRNMVSSKAKNGFNCVSCGTHPNGRAGRVIRQKREPARSLRLRAASRERPWCSKVYVGSAWQHIGVAEVPHGTSRTRLAGHVPGSQRRS
jgi:hypothetical protein